MNKKVIVKKSIASLIIVLIGVFAYMMWVKFSFRRNFLVSVNNFLNYVTLSTYENENIYNKWHDCDFKKAIESESCTKISVPLNWEAKDSPKIGIFIRRIGNPNPKRIIILLSGGPGGNGSEYNSFVQTMYKNNPDQLYIIPNHRGTGFSEPLLCSSDSRLTSMQDIETKDFNKCVDELREKYKGDLKYFNSWQAGMDIHAILSLYPNIKVSIYAASYGTLWAQRVLSIKNDNIDRVYLDSPLPIGYTNLDDRKFELPLKNFYNTCKNSMFCNKRMGVNSFEEVKNIFNGVNSRKKCIGAFNDDLLKTISTRSLWLLQYNFNASLFPLLVSALKNCDVKLVENIFKFDEVSNNMILGKYGYSTYLHHNILCNEMTRDKYSSKNDYGFIDIQNERCSLFPKYSIDKYNKIDFKESKFKTIIVYGDADTSTTPAFAQNLSNQFPESNKLILRLENLAHAPFSFSVDYSEFYEDKFYEGEKCINEILDSFFKGSDTWPDVSCASKLYPPIYSSEKGLTSFEKLVNEFVLYI